MHLEFAKEEVVSKSRKIVVDAGEEESRSSGVGALLDEARARAAGERELSSSTKTAHYEAASMGQSPYVSLPGMGIVVLSKTGWGC